MTDSSKEDALLTADQVCEWFNVTRDWVYDEVEAGRLPFIRLGRRTLRFQGAALTAYLDTVTHKPASPGPPT